MLVLEGVIGVRTTNNGQSWGIATGNNDVIRGSSPLVNYPYKSLYIVYR